MKKKNVKKTESAKKVTQHDVNAQPQRAHPLQAWDEIMFMRRPQPKDQSETKE